MAEDIKTDSLESLHLIYQENSKVMFTFFEWRHKIMLRFFISIAAIFILIQWMYSIESLKNYMYVAFFIGVALSVASALMDKVNQRILNRCYEKGQLIESKIVSFKGVYGDFKDDYLNTETRKRVSYRVILSFLYWGTATAYFAAAIISIINLLQN